MAKLVPKSTEQLLSALEDHLYLLSRTVNDLSTGDAAHLRGLAAQLRALVCTSSGLSGLLWRLRDQVGVDDAVMIRYPGKIDTNNPITRLLFCAVALVRADGSGPDAVAPARWSLQEHIQVHEAAFVDGRSITHEHLIGRLANESGVAHEADGVSSAIAKLNSVLLGDVQPYFSILDADARLTLDVGERVLRAAVSQGYNRRRPASLSAARLDLSQKRFAAKLDVPSTGRSTSEGTLLMVLGMSNVPATGLLEQPVRFPPVARGSIELMAEVTRRRRVRVSSKGLPLPNFGFEFPLPDPLPESIAIVVGWRGMLAKAFAAGTQVAGPAGDP